MNAGDSWASNSPESEPLANLYVRVRPTTALNIASSKLIITPNEAAESLLCLLQD